MTLPGFQVGGLGYQLKHVRSALVFRLKRLRVGSDVVATKLSALGLDLLFAVTITAANLTVPVMATGSSLNERRDILRS